VDVWTALFLGLAAGAIGTVIFTTIEYADIALTKRPPQRDRVKRLNLPTHFMHGTALGVVLGALSLLDLNAAIT
jgi:H+/Cl- antiporter ClcA